MYYHETWARRGGGEEASLKMTPTQDKKGHPPPPKKECAITVFRGLGGMVPQENFNNGALYYISDASQQGHI